MCYRKGNMRMWLVGGVIIICVIIIVVMTDVVRLAKTVYLIVRIEAYEQTVPDAPRILILGDSTAYGTGAARADESIAGRIGADYPGYSIENNSKNGRTIRDLVSVAESVEGEYALILLQAGGNDILGKRSSVVVRNELQAIFNALMDNTEHMVMMSTGNVGGASAFSRTKAEEYERITRAYREMFIETAADNNVAYVDLFVEPAEDPFVQAPNIYLAIDGLHPSSAGYAAWYEKLRPILKQYLEQGSVR